jgi:hypothetical protein
MVLMGYREVGDQFDLRFRVADDPGVDPNL